MNLVNRLGHLWRALLLDIFGPEDISNRRQRQLSSILAGRVMHARRDLPEKLGTTGPHQQQRRAHLQAELHHGVTAFGDSGPCSPPAGRRGPKSCHPVLQLPLQLRVGPWGARLLRQVAPRMHDATRQDAAQLRQPLLLMSAPKISSSSARHSRLGRFTRFTSMWVSKYTCAGAKAHEECARRPNKKLVGEELLDAGVDGAAAGLRGDAEEDRGQNGGRRGALLGWLGAWPLHKCESDQLLLSMTRNIPLPRCTGSTPRKAWCNLTTLSGGRMAEPLYASSDDCRCKGAISFASWALHVSVTR